MKTIPGGAFGYIQFLLSCAVLISEERHISWVLILYLIVFRVSPKSYPETVNMALLTIVVGQELTVLIITITKFLYLIGYHLA